jgi:hypothetical protein
LSGLSRLCNSSCDEDARCSLVKHYREGGCGTDDIYDNVDVVLLRLACLACGDFARGKKDVKLHVMFSIPFAFSNGSWHH